MPIFTGSLSFFRTKKDKAGAIVSSTRHRLEFL